MKSECEDLSSIKLNSDEKYDHLLDFLISPTKKKDEKEIEKKKSCYSKFFNCLFYKK